MKRVDDYTSAELAAMTSADVNSLIDIECALAGIGLLPERPVDPKIALPQPDITIYRVPEMIFDSMPAALAVIYAAMEHNEHRVGKGYDYGHGSGSRYYLSAAPAEVTPTQERVFSREVFERLKGELAGEAKAKGRYEAEVKEYDAMAAKRADVANHVWRAVGDACDEVGRLALARRNYRRYLELAKGDTDQAWTFFAAAYLGDAEEFGPTAITAAEATASQA